MAGSWIKSMDLQAGAELFFTVNLHFLPFLCLSLFGSNTLG
jgi:hypothetical protein